MACSDAVGSRETDDSCLCVLRDPWDSGAVVLGVGGDVDGGVAIHLDWRLSADDPLALLRDGQFRLHELAVDEGETVRIDCYPRTSGFISHTRVQSAVEGPRDFTLFWTAVPYRTEWRYTVASPKLIALDAGHSCQNLYLACEAIGFGTCEIGAYDQEKCDAFLGVDGEDELTVYAAPVGKV